jgi:hypothetical protein
VAIMIMEAEEKGWCVWGEDTQKMGMMMAK